MSHMIETNLARQMARKAGMFCRVSVSASELVFYTGDEAAPATWLMAGRTLIDTRSGVACVARHAVNLICKAHEAPL